jgi:hypothetical protein
MATAAAYALSAANIFVGLDQALLPTNALFTAAVGLFGPATPLPELFIPVVTVFEIPLACPMALAVTVVVFVPPSCPAVAITVRPSVIVVLAPAASVTEVGFTVEALKFVVFESDGASLKVVLAQLDPLSLFIIVTLYATFPPSTVIVCEEGVMLTEGELAVQSDGMTTKVAVTVVLMFCENEHVPVPAHPPPDHPEKIEPAAGVAVSVTTVPAL